MGKVDPLTIMRMNNDEIQFFADLEYAKLKAQQKPVK